MEGLVHPLLNFKNAAVACFGCNGHGYARRAERLVDFGGYLSLAVIDVCTGAALVRVVAVSRHVNAVNVIHALIGACRPFQRFNVIPAADVGEQQNERTVRR